MQSIQSSVVSKAPADGWTALIDDIVAGHWLNPESGEYARVPYDSVVIEESLEGREVELVTSLDMPGSFALVADENTFAAYGSRLLKTLAPLGSIEPVLLNKPHADLATVEKLKQSIKGAQSVIAVGTGTINDLCKYATFQERKSYCVFATAASMNGYTSTTASMTLNSGLKVSLPAHAPKGFFVDLAVSAQAPGHLCAAGFGDCLCRSVAQIDWWMSHRLLGTDYYDAPFQIEMPDERELNKRAYKLPEQDIEATGYLYRVLTLCGLGVSFTGVSNHGSMGEHQISHYIDCFAHERHPGTLHGEQVGVASLSMARMQHYFLSNDQAPVLKPTRMDKADMARRMGEEISKQCFAEYKKKAFDENGVKKINQRLEEIWPELRQELLAFALPVTEMETLLASAGGATTAEELGLSVGFYREAVRHAHEMRNRYSFADIACDTGMLDDFAASQS